MPALTKCLQRGRPTDHSSSGARAPPITARVPDRARRASWVEQGLGPGWQSGVIRLKLGRLGEGDIAARGHVGIALRPAGEQGTRRLVEPGYPWANAAERFSKTGEEFVADDRVVPAIHVVVLLSASLTFSREPRRRRRQSAAAGTASAASALRLGSGTAVTIVTAPPL
jgi:hypothetical protein